MAAVCHIVACYDADDTLADHAMFVGSAQLRSTYNAMREGRPRTVVYGVDVSDMGDDAQRADLDHVGRTIKALRGQPRTHADAILRSRLDARQIAL